MTQTRHPRRIKLIKPRLQLKLIGTFVGLSALTLLLQFLFLSSSIATAATTLPTGGGHLLQILPGLLFDILGFSFGLLLPLTFAIGVLVTFRFAGPIYRFEQYLGCLANGEEVGECKLRQGDDLQELCDVSNRVHERIQSLEEELAMLRATEEHLKAS